jgi:hypothetical protein
MGGIEDQQTHQEKELGTKPGKDEDLAIDKSLKRLREIHHVLIQYKVNLKSLFAILIRAVITLDVVREIQNIKIEDLPFALGRRSQYTLQQFAKVWLVGNSYEKMKYMEIAFDKYKEQKIHARALLASYESLYDGVWKKGTIWLPNYEVLYFWFVFFVKAGRCWRRMSCSDSACVLFCIIPTATHPTGSVEKHGNLFDLSNQVV